MSMDLNFDQARTKHMFFKTKVRGYLLGSDTNSHAFQAYLTELGNWVNALAANYKLNLAELLEINYLHNELTDKTNKLIKLRTSGRHEEAREKFNEIESIGEKFLTTLANLENLTKKD
jgi:hypothetical protein